MKMKQINKTYYWLGLLIFFAVILGLRYFGFLIEIRKEFFYAIFGLWICLILLPLFAEIEFFGIKLKKELDSLKQEVKSEIQSIKFEINNTNKQQVFLGYGPPPSDNKILELEKEINELKEKYHFEPKDDVTSFQTFDNLKITGLAGRFSVSETTVQLFQIRYKLEELLKQISYNYREYFNYQNDRILSPTRMLNDLKSIDIIDLNIIGLTRDILSICNAAVHGKKVTEKQVDFVIKNGRLIYDTLYELTQNE